MLKGCGATRRRRLTVALDELTIRWATNTLPSSCRWQLNTQVLFLKESREPTPKLFDDAEWLEWLRSEAAQRAPSASEGYSGDAGDSDEMEWDDDVDVGQVEAIGPELPPGWSCAGK